MNERASAGLRGQVSACRTDVTMYVRGCSGERCESEPKEESYWTVARYHPDGRLAEYLHHNADGSEWVSKYRYDDAGRLQEIETREGGGSQTKTIHQYDDRGRLERVVVRSADGRENTVQTSSYPGQRKTKTQYFHTIPGRANSAVMFSIEGSEAAVSAPGAASMTTVYDEQGKPVEAVICDSHEKPIVRVTLSYDDAGRLVEESQTTEMEETFPPEMLAQLNAAQARTAQTIFGRGSQWWKQVHRYDAAGRRVETISSWGPLGEERRTMAYNEYGDLREEKLFRGTKEISIDGEGSIVPTREHPSAGEPSSEVRFSYEYDEYGNWIERVVSGRHGPEESFRVSSVESRRITYHPA